MSSVFLKYINRATGKAFYTHHQNIEHRDSFLRKVFAINDETKRDAKCDVQEVSEQTYLAGQERGAR